MQMRNMILISAILAVGLTACTMRPKEVLSPSKMRKVLVDLHTADGVLQVANYNYSRNDEKNIYYQSVLEKNGVSQAEFDSSLVWYTDNPKIFEKIYLKVIADLETAVAELDQRYKVNNDTATVKPDLAFLDSLLPKYPQRAGLLEQQLMEILLDTCYQIQDSVPFQYVYALQMQDSLSVIVPKDTVETVEKQTVTFKKVTSDMLMQPQNGIADTIRNKRIVHQKPVISK